MRRRTPEAPAKSQSDTSSSQTFLARPAPAYSCFAALGVTEQSRRARTHNAGGKIAPHTLSPRMYSGSPPPLRETMTCELGTPALSICPVQGCVTEPVPEPIAVWPHRVLSLRPVRTLLARAPPTSIHLSWAPAMSEKGSRIRPEGRPRRQVSQRVRGTRQRPTSAPPGPHGTSTATRALKPHRYTRTLHRGLRNAHRWAGRKARRHLTGPRGTGLRRSR